MKTTITEPWIHRFWRDGSERRKREKRGRLKTTLLEAYSWNTARSDGGKRGDGGPIKEDAGMKGEEGEDRWSEGMEGKRKNRHERAGKEERGCIRRTGERRLAVWF